MCVLKGAVEATGLVAPEAQLGVRTLCSLLLFARRVTVGRVSIVLLYPDRSHVQVLPNIIGMLDGVSTLIFDGLTSCSGGFGSSCNKDGVNPSPQATLANTGLLRWAPSDISSTQSVVDELSLLLTDGRLDTPNYNLIATEYILCPVNQFDSTEISCLTGVVLGLTVVL